MKHYDFAQKFYALHDRAAALYIRGQRGAETFCTVAERAWLAANGLTPQHLYDYAEDFANYDEPGPDLALAIELVRRDYFLNAQHGRPSQAVLDESALPSKTTAVQGIEWLPLLIPKARAKLRGELPASLMFCCGGDRAFFKKHDILPAEFLNLVWRYENDNAAVVSWALRRAAEKSQE
ncbi:MAG: DUF5069 domain-containing protein [Verrucomicrobiota bacterium]